MKKNDELIPFVVKMTPELRESLQGKANLYANGNVSEWLRRAGMQYEPEVKDNGTNRRTKS